MQRARRRVIVGSVLAWLASWLAPARAAPVQSSQGSPAPQPRQPPSQSDASLRNATLRAYVDVLIPADEAPSGTALGVDMRLLAVAKGQDAYQRVLDLGLDWLNRQAQLAHGRNFPALDEGARDAIVQRMATANFNMLPRVFFERTRADAFFHYYGRAESWRGIARYRGAPQPAGFMDYTQPPRASR